MKKDIYMIIEKENDNLVVKWLKETEIEGWFKPIGKLEIENIEELKTLIPNESQLRCLMRTGLVNLNW